MFESIKTYPNKIEFHWLNVNQADSSSSFDLIGSNVFWGIGGDVFLNNNVFSICTYGKKSRKKYTNHFLRNIFHTRIVVSNGNYLLSDIWSDGPYHFYIDVCLKLMALEYNGRDCADISIVLKKSEFIERTGLPFLVKIGMKFKSIILIEPSEPCLIVGGNYYVQKTHVSGSNNSKYLSILQKKIQEFKPVSGNNTFDKVYYFRRNRNRTVVNDTELIPVLEALGFYCTDFDSLSYLEAWSLMQNVKLFLGIHGGGMTNMIFMPENARVIEIKTSNPNPRNHCYWHLAESLELDYTMFAAESIDETDVIEGYGCNVRVNIAVLMQLVELNMIGQGLINS